MISSYISQSRVAMLFRDKVNCDFCRQPIDWTRLPQEIQSRLRSIRSTIPTSCTPTMIEDFHYHYADDNRLRHCLTNETFTFISTRHYNALGNCVEKHIQTLMKSNPWNYQEIWLPIKNNSSDDHRDQVNIFVSDDFQSNRNGCLILIQGSGVVRAGQWARSCCINDSLDIGGKYTSRI
jgi:hypothetical protein